MRRRCSGCRLKPKQEKKMRVRAQWQPICSIWVVMRMSTLSGFFTAVVMLMLMGCAPMHFGVGVTAAPICPYGYYEVPPYDCAPDGFYGPEWFSNGVFIGAGP